MKEEKFVIHLRSISNLERYFYVNINIPESRHYTNFKLYVKDFIVLTSDAPNTTTTSPDIWALCSDSFIINNNYDNFTTLTDDTLLLSSKVLEVVTQKAPYINNGVDSYFNILNINGRHRFWLENFNSVKSNDEEFFVTFIIVASN
jgi:hypothetical protein